ncbi:hypothetical protein SLE2022_105900 [Rubroshorea leprosula]
MENTEKLMAKKQQLVPGIWGIRSSFHSLIILLIVVLILACVYDLRRYSIQDQLVGAHKNSNGVAALSGCNLLSGQWVYDNKSYPLYKEKECMFMSDQIACEKFGRNGLNYHFWRWQPHQCDLPRFNATALLERLRNKRLMYVGDSLNRNQWVSMVCLLGSVIPAPFKSKYQNGSLYTFKAIEYNATVEFYWAPLMVESNSDDPVNHRMPDRIVRVQAIEKHARYWTDADILVFNSYLWWRRDQMKVLWGSFDSSDGIYKEMETLRAYEMALKTWADWLEVHVNRTKTKLFFVGLSPTHEKAESWGGEKGQNCYNETEPVPREGYLEMESDLEPEMMQVVEKLLHEMPTRGLSVQFINITRLSMYRKEGHPSIYRKHWEPLTDEQISNPSSYADCIHWCLPGVPDVWNELLYAYIFDKDELNLVNKAL